MIHSILSTPTPTLTLPHSRPSRVIIHLAMQDAVEVDDKGAQLVARCMHLLRGPAATGVTAADCKLVTVNMLASMSTVRTCSNTAMSWSSEQRKAVIMPRA